MRTYDIPLRRIVRRLSFAEWPGKLPGVHETNTPSRQNFANTDLDMVIIATQIRIHGLSGFVRFLCSVRRVRAQLAGADGLLFARFRGTQTMTGWRNEEAMRAFRNSGAHLEAMRSLRTIGQARSTSWRAHEVPDWNAAVSRLCTVEFRP